MKKITAMIEDDLLLALDQVARNRRITRSEALREAIAAYTGKLRSNKRLPSFAACGRSSYPGSLGEEAEKTLKRRSTRSGWV